MTQRTPISISASAMVAANSARSYGASTDLASRAARWQQLRKTSSGTVPELVFLNCCHLAARDAKSVLAPTTAPQFAANIAEALIEIGVRCVIAAGWAVEDKPAELFATTFYDALLGGGRFIDAVAAARSAAWRTGAGGNTWSAYQCYGDPGWTWQRDVGDAQRAGAAPSDEFAGVSSPPALTLALETISIRLRFGGDDPKRRKSSSRRSATRSASSRRSSRRSGAGWARSPKRSASPRPMRAIADKAIEWYRSAVQAEDGSASFKAAEELGNQLARRGEARDDLREARRDIEEAIARLGKLAEIQTDGRARGAARLGIQAAGDDRGAPGAGRGGSGHDREGAQARQGGGRQRRRRPPRRVARDGAPLRQRRAAGARGQRRQPLLSGQERHQRRAASGLSRAPAGRARRRPHARSAGIARARGDRAARLLVGRRPDRAARARAPSPRSSSPANRRRRSPSSAT